MRRMWLTGYRSYELNVFKDDDPKVKVIKKVLTERLHGELEAEADEYWLISGPQMGTERWGLECGLDLQDDYPQLKLALMEPYTDFAQRWNEANQEKLAVIKTKINFTAPVTAHPYQSPQQLRTYQQFMLTHTDRMLMLYDPEYEGKPKYDYHRAQQFGEEHDYPLSLIDFDELQEAAVEWSKQEHERQNQN
ncbi:DUF1273 domain-containing protein [Limosilactobacillus kribbianus]|uniref:DUF1273 domain-containing protein n=1 Tax=Limosilactobacillus kribbianus TaxID=2982695 RepID=UPI002264286F|nr:DUF1273 domain-containing protein [Limosilactobacillus kribbianus]